MNNVLSDLEQTLLERKAADPDQSYVASLYAHGINKILEKIGEESVETIIAAKDYDGSEEHRRALTGEIADLWFHSMVMLGHLDISYTEVLAVLEQRFGRSGLEEKASRNRHNASPTE